MRKQHFLYFALVKYSDENNVGVLDEAVDSLCTAPILELSSVGLHLQLDSLISQGSKDAAVVHLCRETRLSLLRCSEDKAITLLLLGRALEAAGVAYGLEQLSSQYRPVLESRLYETQGLRHLLKHRGHQVLQDVAGYINQFRCTFVEHALAAHAALLGLIALRRSHPEVYKLVSQQKKPCAKCSCRGMRRFKTVSLSLDEELPQLEAAKPCTVLPGRRAFSVDVHAGLERLHIEALAPS